MLNRHVRIRMHGGVGGRSREVSSYPEFKWIFTQKKYVHRLAIKEVGILQSPLITILDGDIVPLGGNRRIAASKFLKHENVVCEIKHFTESPKNTLAAIVENTARKN